MRFAFIHAEKANHSIARLCRVLQVTRAGYYAWRDRGPSRTETRRRHVEELVQLIFLASYQTYGSPRVLAELRETHGIRVSKRTVENAMKTLGIQARKRKSFRNTTERDETRPVVANILDRDFAASRPNEKWVSDITYIQTAKGWSYLAVILDLFSRKVVGWSLRSDLTTELVLSAFNAALISRAPEEELVHHSDRGRQYTSYAFELAATQAGVRLSMSRKGNCWDNAVAESFFSTLKQELISRRTWRDEQDVRSALFEYIEVFYNRERRHSTLGYVSPEQFEVNHAAFVA